MFYCLWHLRVIVPLLITILLSNSNPPSASRFVIGAGITLPDKLASLHCLRVPECILFKVTHRTVNGSDPVYLSSYFHTSRWRASSNETAIIHIRPTHCFILQPRYCRQAGLSSLRRQSLKQYSCTCRISTVVHGFPASSQEFSLPALLLLNYLTLKSLHSVVDLTVTLVSGYIKNVVDDDDDDDTSLISAEVPLRVIRCNYHTRALRHVRKHLTTETIQTIACSIISSRFDYCNSLLYGAPVFSRREAAESSEQLRQSYAIIANVSVPDHY